MCTVGLPKSCRLSSVFITLFSLIEFTFTYLSPLQQRIVNVEGVNGLAGFDGATNGLVGFDETADGLACFDRAVDGLVGFDRVADGLVSFDRRAVDRWGLCCPRRWIGGL